MSLAIYGGVASLVGFYGDGFIMVASLIRPITPW